MTSSEYKKLFADLELAYIKLKSYVYYDNTLTELRAKISAYEAGGIKSQLYRLTKEVTDYKEGNTAAINAKITNISYNVKPKKFVGNGSGPNGYTYVSNENVKTEYGVVDVIHYIECHVDLHILSVYWLIEIGYKLDSRVRQHCYAYRMGKRKYGKGLFIPYFLQYQQWRDNAIEAAIASHKSGMDVAFINLDVKSYFDSIDMDLSMFDGIATEAIYLNQILKDIHATYATKRKIAQKILPIGLLSSGVLANYYLKGFDADIITKLHPVYYGRYVDDILVVIAKPSISGKSNLVSTFIKKKGLCKLVGDEYVLEKFPTLSFKEEKVKAYLVKAADSPSILEEFRKKVRENSSEFRWLPEEEAVFSTFTENSFKLNYSGSVNKIRSIEGFDNDKFGASRHLSTILTTIKHLNKLEYDTINELRGQLLEYFKGQRNIEFYQLWEKVLSVFVIIGDKDGFVLYIVQVVTDIYKIKYKKKKELLLSLIRYLKKTISMAISLDNGFYDNLLDAKLKNEIGKIKLNYNITPYFSITHINKAARQIFAANMFRHAHSYFPLLNVCKTSNNSSLIQYNLKDHNSWELQWEKIRFYPRFVHIHELLIFYRIRKAFLSDNLPNVGKIYRDYLRYNRLPREFTQWYPRPVNSMTNNFLVVSQARHVLSFKGIRTSLINSVVRYEDSFNNLYGNPVLTADRYFKLNKLLNDSVRHRCNLVAFPEISIPVQWLYYISEFSRKNNTAIVAGLEHFANAKREAFNFSAVTLPYKTGHFQNFFVDMRLKINYSPGEIETIKDPKAINGPYLVPEYKQYKERMRLYNWLGNYFSVFNCYELTDIGKRALFKGNADFIIVIVHNKDTLYFANIIESYSRDAHLFVVQVNTSEYGDSRITQPSKSETKDLAKIKGGKNFNILVEPLDVSRLRAFQALTIADQAKDASFKTTPPGYKIATFRK